MEENNKELNQEPIQETKQATMQEEQPQVTETVKVSQETDAEPKFTPMGQINEPKNKKKKGKFGVVIFVLLLLVAIIGGLAYYYFNVYTNPKLVYQQIVKTGIDSLTTSSDEEITTLKAKLDLDIKLDSMYMEDGVEEVLDLVNNTDAAVEMQIDTNEKKALVKFASNYENEELLNFDMLFDAKNQEAYVKIDQFLDKVLEVEMEEEYFDELEAALEIEGKTEDQKISREKAIEIIKAELENAIKDQYCSKEKEKITVNSKEVNADKYILKMTYSEFMSEAKNILENLKNNEEFLNCFEEKYEKKETLEDAIAEIEDLELEEEATIYVKLYRTGLKQEFVRVDFEIEANGKKLILKVEKAKDEYKFELTFENETYCSGTIKTEKLEDETVKLYVSLDIKEIGTIALNMEYGLVINEAIDTMDTKNAVTEDELSQADMLRMVANLQESKLYEVIEKFSDMSDDTIIDNDDEEDETELPSRSDNNLTNGAESNISYETAVAENGKLIVFLKNNNTVPVEIDVEVEFYDADGKILGSSSDYLMAVGAGVEGAMEMRETPASFDNYKIYIDVEESDEIEYFDKIEMTHNDNGENIAVQVKNNSTDTIDYITVAVVYYNKGKVVGFDDGTASEVKAGRSGNFNIYYPYDAEYEDVEFDDYKVYVTEAYSYNW